jgi:hypothetical protein
MAKEISLLETDCLATNNFKIYLPLVWGISSAGPDRDRDASYQIKEVFEDFR